MTKYEIEKLANQVAKASTKLTQMRQQLVAALRDGNIELAKRLDFASVKINVQLGFLLQKLHK